MIRKEDFYVDGDSPGKSKTDEMWRSIQRSAAPLRHEPWLVRDRRSFAYGMAASVVLGLALVGAWTIARQSFENAQPQPLRVEQAYVSAIHEFERVVPLETVKSTVQPQVAGQLQERQEQIRLINAAIADLRKETNGRDLSPLKRERLRELYSRELRILQQMIEQGEIEL